MDSIPPIKTDTSFLVNTIPVDTLKTELITKPSDPVYIKQIGDKGINLEFIIPTIIAIISLFIVLYDRLKRPKIGAQILSLTHSPKSTFTSTNINNNEIKIVGQQYFFKLSFQVTNKSLFFQDVKIKVKYANDKKEYNGQLFWADPLSWSFDNGKKYDLLIPKDEFLWFNNNIAVNTVSFRYLTFMVEVDKPDRIEKLCLTFVDEKGKKKRIKTLKLSEMDTKKMLFDKDLWIEQK